MMRLRPIPTQWFEMIVPQTMAAEAIAVLGETGAVELEVTTPTAQPLPLAEWREQSQTFDTLKRRYGAYWPEPSASAEVIDSPATVLMANALARLRAWDEAARDAINRLEALRHEAATVAFWRDSLRALADADVDLTHLCQARESLGLICACPGNDQSLDEPIATEAVTLIYRVGEKTCVLAICRAESMAALVQQIEQQQWQVHTLPQWLTEGMDFEHRLARRRQEIAAAQNHEQVKLAVLNEHFQVAQAYGYLLRLQWFLAQVDAVATSTYFAWITGWTNKASPTRLAAAASARGIPTLVHFPVPPAGLTPPLQLHHRGLTRYFQVFVEALGMPGQNEADPTPLLALIVPLLFGYMFGDVGHGFVLLLTGWLLRRRFAMARLLMVAGAAGMGFGFLFGSVFARTDILPALWLQPLHHPMLTLAVPMIAGFLLLALGIALAGLQTYWHRSNRYAWLGDAGFLGLYIGFVLGMFEPRMLWLAGAGFMLYLGIHARAGIVAAFAALGHLLESTFQILINTLSFVRVGAFALAHEGLSSAVSGMADAANQIWLSLAIMVFGNVFIIVLEGVVVSIQVTRLILFEFFVRFLRGSGRVFKPLPVPPTSLRGSST